MKLSRRIFYQTDDPGGGTTVEEPKSPESGGYFNPSEADLIATANEELRSVAEKIRSGQVVTDGDGGETAPAPPAQQEAQSTDEQGASSPPVAPAAKADQGGEKPQGQPGVPAFLSRFGQKAEQAPPQDGQEPQSGGAAPAVSPSGEIDRDAFFRMLETPQGVNRLIGLLYESGREENVALARQLDQARQAPPPQEAGSEPATSTEPDHLDIPPFNPEEARAAIEKVVREELDAEHTPPIMDFDEDGNPIPVPTKFKPDVNPAHRRQMEKEIARRLENAEAKHEAKRAFAETERWRREQETEAQARRSQEIESAYEEDNQRIGALINKGLPLRMDDGQEFSSRELFTDASGARLPLAERAFKYIRKQLESDFFQKIGNPAHEPEFDLTPLQNRLSKLGPGSRDPRVLAKEMTRLAVETFIAENVPRAGQPAAASSPMNGTSNGVNTQPPKAAWPANMPGPVSNATQQPAQQGATQSVDDMVADLDKQLAQEYGGTPPTEVLEKRYSQLLRDLQAPR
jgi:hypothetical protein